MSKLNRNKRQAKRLASAEAKYDAWTPTKGKDGKTDYSTIGWTGAEQRAFNKKLTSGGYDKDRTEQDARAKEREKSYQDLMTKNKAAGEMTDVKHTMDLVPKSQATPEQLSKAGYKETASMTAEEAKDRADKGLGTKFEKGSGIHHKFDDKGFYQNKAIIDKPIKIDANLPDDPGITSTADLGTEVPIKQATDTRQNTAMKNTVNKTNLKDSQTALNTSTPTKDTSTDTNTSASSGGIDASEYDDYTKNKDWSGTGKSDPNAEIEQHFDDPSLSPYQKQKVKEAGQEVYANNPIGQYNVGASGMASYTPAGGKTSSPKPVTTPKNKVSQEELDKSDRDKLFRNLDKKTFGL